MTLQEIEAKLFPSVYQARNGELVEIVEFAFKGMRLNADNTRRENYHVWDRNLNLFIPVHIITNDPKQYDLMKLIKSPSIEYLAADLKK